MKFFITTLTASFLLMACASSPVYSPASDNGFGYSHSQLDSNSYRVHF